MRILHLTLSMLLMSSICHRSLAEKPKVGALLTLSGAFSAIGQDGRNGIALAIAEYGDNTPFEVVYGDSKSDPQTAISEFRRFVNQEGVAAVYVFRGPPGMAVNPISKQMKIPLLGGVGNKVFTEQNEFAIQVWPSSDFEGAFLAEDVIQRGKRVAIVTLEDDWTASLSTGFRSAFLEKGGEIVVDEFVHPEDSDFRTVILKIVSAKPDAVFVNVGVGQIGPIVKQLREARLPVPLYSNFWAGKKEVRDAAGAAIAGVRFDEISPDMPKLSAMAKERFNTNLNSAFISAYLGARAFLEVFETGTATTPETIRERFLELDSLDTPDGPLEIVGRKVIFKLKISEIPVQ